MTLLRLPPELIEQILIETVNFAAPNSVAAVAATCRQLHDLVHSIWRDLFLTVFDDPRPKRALLAAAPAAPAAGHGYKWHTFTERIAAANSLRAAVATCDFITLIEVIATAAPIPPFQVLESPRRRHVAFPPLLRQTPTSSNIAWLEHALAAGYPPLLTKRLLAAFSSDPETAPFSLPEFEDTPQGAAFHKLVFMRGFLPTLGEDPDHQYITARAIARTRVYNTKYLNPERCWGPGSRRRHEFHPSSIIISPDLLDADDDIDDADYDPDADDSDTDHHGHGDTPHLLHFLASNGIDFTNDQTHPTFVFPAPHRVVPDYAFLAAARLIIESNMRDKFEMEGMWQNQNVDVSSQMAAADVGLDLGDVIDAMRSLNLTRMGGAPGFWNAWRPEKSEEDEDASGTPPPVDKGKGKATDGEIDGWDWAGVEGEWRRVVCWLDYRDLLMHNVGNPPTGFGTEDLQETIRIFPMTLRISRYSPPPRPPPGADLTDLIWRLPVIHIYGESRGTDTDETSARVVEGTVRLIGDGAVRWSLTSAEAAGHAPEWVTESVQVGDLGSALGIIGLWTGADHSTTDPLGPCWAWKIA
ncbi:hypothetical protein C8J57DRAFT_1161663 [Mycena rebaudengoi]|nr:hypothetical protein C8J57DRAFT_1161663 [Mycena rebaudengoi]